MMGDKEEARNLKHYRVHEGLMALLCLPKLEITFIQWSL